MASRLTEIVENKKREVAERKALHEGNGPTSASQAVASGAQPESSGTQPMASGVEPGDGSFAAALREPGVNLICELKPKSPSAGVLKNDFDVKEILPHYKKHAAAISVLTDEKYFGGSLSLLADVVCKSGLPALCKDFFIDPYQCIEARAAGAQAILLIVKILEDKRMAELYNRASELGMTSVVEVQNREELDRALDLNPEIILINNRNLDTFEISLDTTRELAPHIPDSVIKISASGFSTREEIESTLPFCHNFLIGSSLMTADNLEQKLAQLKGAV